MVEVDRSRRKSTPPLGRPRRSRPAPPALDPGAPADASLRRILRFLLDVVRSHQAALDREDPDGLHDLRVALRRARSVLGQLRLVLDGERVKHLRGELGWLGSLTGPVRDRDVLLERLESVRGAIGPEDGPALDVLAALVRRERAAARREVAKDLGVSRLERLLAEWEELALEPATRAGRATPPRPRGSSGAKPAVPANADRPIGAVAGEAIGRAWRRLLRHGRAATTSSPAEVFHRVRIDGKKLRYLLELFAPVYPGVDLAPIIADLKRLQDSLGERNDAAVRERELRRLGRALAESGAGVEPLLLLGRLVERARTAGAEAAARFEERFAALTVKENRRRIRRVAEGV